MSTYLISAAWSARTFETRYNMPGRSETVIKMANIHPYPSSLILLLPGGLRPPDPLSRSLAGPHSPHSAHVARSLRSLARDPHPDFGSGSASHHPDPDPRSRFPSPESRVPSPESRVPK